MKAVMRNLKQNFLGIILCLNLFSHTAIAAPLDDAKQAADHGNFAKAAEIYQALADQGEAKAQYNLGLMYFNGDGVKQDYNEAIRYYTLSSDQGFSEAQYALAVIYFTGRFAKPDYEESFRLYRLAAEQGHLKSQLNLGTLYLKGEVVEQNYDEALKWLNMAAEKGYGEAQFMLANMYLHGDGVPEDISHAYMWVALSLEDKKHQTASKLEKRENSLDFLSVRMKPEELAKGKALVDECHSKQLVGC